MHAIVRSFALLVVSLALSSTVRAAAGDLDLAFGSFGLVVDRAGTGAAAMLLQPDGNVVVAGQSADGKIVLARHRPDGSLDATFGAGGIVETLAPPGAGAYPRIDALALQRDGKLVVAGVGYVSGQLAVTFAFVRFNADGSIDTSFGDGGGTRVNIASLTQGAGTTLGALLIQNDGRIVAAGYSLPGVGPWGFTLVRMESDGRLDATFGGLGVIRSGTGGGGAAALAIEPDGRIVAAGQAGATLDSAWDSPRCLALLRYTSSGSLDASFGVRGLASWCASAPSGASALHRLGDGRLLVAGFHTVAGARRPIVARFHADGSLDATFGAGGVSEPAMNDTEATALSVQFDGRIVVAGDRFSIARLGADGAPDASFGVAGVAAEVVPGGVATALVVEPDVRILVAGSAPDQRKRRSIAIAALHATPFGNAAAGTVVEYVNIADFPAEPGGHYFYTLDGSAEAQAVDSGVAGRFLRTGKSWKAGGTASLARFYGSQAPGPNSHFYSLTAAEVNLLSSLQQEPAPLAAQQWNLEGFAFAATPPLVDASGTRSCPFGRVPVFRAYNNAWNGSVRNAWDSNHRYSTDRAAIQAMASHGWSDEGIAFCAMP
jgi:uncharacterized delta-60 repeat protein